MSENIEIKETDKKKDNKKIVIIIVVSVLAFFLVFGAPIGCFVCAVGMGAVSSSSSSSEDLSELYGMNKEEIDRIYGKPTWHNGLEGYIESYRYSEGFIVTYACDEIYGKFSCICISEKNSKELCGLQVGDDVSKISKEMENWGFRLANNKFYEGQMIYIYVNDGGCYIKIWVANNTITAVELS